MKIFKLLILLMLTNYYLLLFTLSPVHAQTSLQSYCQGGYYVIPGEKKCSRAPQCGGMNYDQVNALPAPDNNDCVDNSPLIGSPANTSAYDGYVPLCCYELTRTGDPLMCNGYWERKFCTDSQCNQIDLEKGRICNSGQPGKCGCGNGLDYWSQQHGRPLKPLVPLEVRLHLQVQPKLPPPTSIPPTRVPTLVLPTAPIPTKIIIPTAIPIRPLLIGPTVAPSIQVTIPTPSAASPTNPVVQNTIGIRSFNASITNSIAHVKISALKAVIASKKILDLPGYTGTKILDLDKHLELFMNNLFRQIFRI